MLCKSDFSPPLRTNGQCFLNPLLHKVMDFLAGQFLKFYDMHSLIAQLVNNLPAMQETPV